MEKIGLVVVVEDLAAAVATTDHQALHRQTRLAHRYQTYTMYVHVE